MLIYFIAMYMVIGFMMYSITRMQVLNGRVDHIIDEMSEDEISRLRELFTEPLSIFFAMFLMGIVWPAVLFIYIKDLTLG